MPEPLRLRVQEVPPTLVVVRLGSITMSDDRLAKACARTYERWAVFGFSVLKVPGGDDYALLARLRPEVAQRRQLLVADGHALTADGSRAADARPPALDRRARRGHARGSSSGSAATSEDRWPIPAGRRDTPGTMRSWT